MSFLILEDKNYEVSDECRMVEGSRHPCCKDDVPDRCGSGRDTDARRHGGLGCSWQRSDCGRRCISRYQPCRSAGTGKTVKKTKKSPTHQALSRCCPKTTTAISNELLNDSAFDLATYIARRFGVRMGNAEERAFITGDGVGKPLGLLAETGGAKVGVTAAQKDAVTFDEIFKLYYALKAPYRKKAQFLCNEALVLQLMTIKDNNGNYIWKPGLEIGKPDTLLNRPLKTSAFMPEIKGGSKVMAFGDYSYYWVADRQNRTFRRLNELYARTDQVGFLTTQRVDGKLILPEAVQLLQMAPQG